MPKDLADFRDHSTFNFNVLSNQCDNERQRYHELLSPSGSIITEIVPDNSNIYQNNNEQPCEIIASAHAGSSEDETHEGNDDYHHDVLDDFLHKKCCVDSCTPRVTCSRQARER
jgi:hypothetical protein